MASDPEVPSRELLASTKVRPADGPVKSAVLAGNSARLYGLEKHAELVRHDRFAAMKADYLANGGGRSNLRYGYIARPA